MIATINDAAVLSAVRPLELISYLRSKGWNQAQEKPGQWSAWTRRDPQGEEYEASVPLNQGFRDFPARIGDVLRVLAAHEGRSQLEVLRDLLVTWADVIRFGVADADLPDATLPLEDGAMFVQKVRELILAAASAAVYPRTYYPSRKPSQAMDYLRKARLGQTEPGSFVVTIISPVPPGLATPDGQMTCLEDPFERQVTKTLAIALTAARQAAEDAASTGSVASFVMAVPKGVSANFCDALVGMGSWGGRNHRLDIELSWSRSRPVSPGSALPARIILDEDVFPWLREAAAFLKETSPREEFEVRGIVFRLERDEGAATGRVTIHGLVDEQPRTVLVELSDVDYHKALKAHDERRLVKCSGLLIREGRAYRLQDPDGFAVEQDDES